MKIVVTGAGGLLGWHASARIHAINCAAMHKGKPKPHELVALNRNTFNDDEKLYAGLIGQMPFFILLESIEVETRILRQAILRLPDVFPNTA